MAAAKNEQVIEIRPIELETVSLKILGDTPLIMHQWSEKAKRQLLENMMKTTKTKSRDPKDPVDEFIRSMYWLTDMPTDTTERGYEKAIREGARFGFPVTAFKQAAISASYRMGWSKDKMSLRGVFFIEADERELVETTATNRSCART